MGAGASGLMFASTLDKNRFKNIALFDANSKIGQKIKISGGAKCNITNEFAKYDRYLGDKEFAKEILNQFSKNDLLKFLKRNNIEPKLREKLVKGAYFCESSQDIIDMFGNILRDTKIYLNTKVLDIVYCEEYFKIITQNNEYKAKKVVISSGGLSFATLNASDIAFKIAEKFGHNIVQTAPALVGFTVQKEQFWFKNLSGISLDVNIKLEEKNIEGSLLFAHKGCSGPAILNSSLYWKKGKFFIDFLPKHNLEKLLKTNKNISTAIPLPKRFLQEFLNSIELEDKACSKLSEDEKCRLKILKNYEMSPAGNFGFTKAEVTKGGICTDEINHQTFESKKQKDLFFIGECLDLTGELGGFNFQIVFAQAYLCAIGQNNS
ncbi:NAD(P)/FAD-dependent oxidoreductase [Aliarcobacter thereius]|uniref:NAD(P)/FAD-dependent oxidoreductase n=1 Tax=Aliarcobacter thereius TaxID=544718 RepID=UPI001D17CA68|nr:aminoacetone oxidase family FAD-binding enzyme [Aliarcobacter thereius]HJE02724.1 aminoacetone oxidase family FAD-binding enzyme [Aliarcobacter thereius]